MFKVMKFPGPLKPGAVGQSINSKIYESKKAANSRAVTARLERRAIPEQIRVMPLERLQKIDDTGLYKLIK